MAWDREDILEFASLLYDLYHSICLLWDAGMDCWRETEEALEDYINPASFPSCSRPQFPPSDEHIWATDSKGGRLVSLDFGSTNYGRNLKRLVRI